MRLAFSLGPLWVADLSLAAMDQFDGAKSVEMDSQGGRRQIERSRSSPTESPLGPAWTGSRKALSRDSRLNAFKVLKGAYSPS